MAGILIADGATSNLNGIGIGCAARPIVSNCPCHLSIAGRVLARMAALCEQVNNVERHLTQQTVDRVQMPLELPRELLASIREGRAILFTGAGASRGGIGEKDATSPDGAGLAQILTKEFLGDGYDGLDLKSVYDLACSVRDVRTVQKRLYEIFNPIQPAPFHLLIPEMPWAGILTTNYDLIVERAYAKLGKADRIIPNTKDYDGATDRLGNGAILYVKLHGCITRYQEISPPMIASTEQLITFRDGRKGQFDTFLEWAKTKTIIFCGYAFLDSNLRALFAEIVREGDNRPRHYIVNKGAREAEIGYWQDRRVGLIDATFENFLVKLNHDIPANQRKLGLLAAEISNNTSLSRYITLGGAKESDELKEYLDSLIELVPSDVTALNGDPKRFYSGFDQGWFPFTAELDIRLPVVGNVTRQFVEKLSISQKHPIVVIKGHAGSGKTVALRRICYDAAVRFNRLCFYVGRGHAINTDMFREILSLTNLPIFLFVDNVSEHRAKLAEVISIAKRQASALQVICTESFHIWNVSCDDLDIHVSESFEMTYLSETSITLLLEKLEVYDSLGYLAKLPADKRVAELRFVHGRQLLVALLEATHGIPLVEIIEQEYHSIEPDQARLIYLDICSLHRFGPPVRAGLISRIHNISFNDFSERLFKPLEAIVTLRDDKRSGDFVYEARHSYIASTLYEAVLKTQDERFDNLIRIISKLNPSFSYDNEVLLRLIRADGLQKAIADHSRIRQVYDAAISSFGERAVILHQRGIFELHIASNAGGLDVAEALLQKASELEPFNKSIKHSLAELDLRRSRIAQTPEDRAAWRRSAVTRAAALVGGSTSAYPHHTLLKAAVDGVKDALDANEANQSEASVLRLGEAIAHAENTLKKGRQAFPNEAILLSEEGNLSTILSQATRAEASFQKAFVVNERSTLIARRLSRIKRAKGSHSEAMAVIRKALEFNPGSQELHYDLAMTLIESSPDADQTDADTLLYHLRRSFTPGDKNYQAQFWYARQLSITNRFPEGKALFRTLAEAPLPFREKTEARAELRDPDGQVKWLVGNVGLWRESWGFIECQDPTLSVFFVLREKSEEISDYISVGTTLRFNLAFSLRGPVATDVEFV